MNIHRNLQAASREERGRGKAHWSCRSLHCAPPIRFQSRHRTEVNEALLGPDKIQRGEEEKVETHLGVSSEVEDFRGHCSARIAYFLRRRIPVIQSNG